MTLPAAPPEHQRSLRGVLAGATQRRVPPEGWEAARQQAWKAAGLEFSFTDALLWAEAREQGAATIYSFDTFDRRFPAQGVTVSG